MVVLVVDDNIQVQSFVCKCLLGDGFTVLAADSGETALEVFRSHSGTVDILLTDMEMPGMDGLELCQLILSESPQTKVLLMSGELVQRERPLMSRFTFLPKPFTLTVLRQAIEASMASCSG